MDFEEIDFEAIRQHIYLISSNQPIEEYKNELSLRADFNLLDVFKLFDKKGNGFINLQDL